jgi:AAA ATPase-like protein
VRVSTQTLIQLGPDLIGIFVPGGSLLARLPTLLATNSKLADKIAERVAPGKDKAASKADPALDQEKIFEQYAAVLKALCAEHTLILMLDDLQWADSGSLNLLFHIARELVRVRRLAGVAPIDDAAAARLAEERGLRREWIAAEVRALGQEPAFAVPEIRYSLRTHGYPFILGDRSAQPIDVLALLNEGKSRFKIRKPVSVLQDSSPRLGS